MQVEIRSGKDLTRVTKNLAAMGDGRVIRRRMAKEIRQEVRPVANRLKAAYRGNPSKNQPNPPGRGDLRRLLARAVTVQVRTSGKNAGAVIRVDGRRMPDQMGKVPALYEGRERWRHRVFGSDTWVKQDPTPTFDRIVPQAAPAVRRRINDAAEGLARDVVKGRVSRNG